MKKTRRFLSILFASAMVLSSMLCAASATERVTLSPFAGETVPCKIVDAMTGEEETVMVVIPQDATLKEQQDLVHTIAQNSAETPMPLYDPITTGATRLSYKHLNMKGNRDYNLGSGTLDGDARVAYVDFIDYDTLSANEVTVTFTNVDKGDSKTCSADVAGARITVFVFRSEGVDMRKGDELEAEGYADSDLEADVYLSVT